jgi:acyl-CoA thioesterase FadM
MFEVRLQTCWADVDAAGIVYYSHSYRFVEQAEEELFRAAGKRWRPLLEEHGIWMPRVEDVIQNA